MKKAFKGVYVHLSELFDTSRPTVQAPPTVRPIARPERKVAMFKEETGSEERLKVIMHSLDALKKSYVVTKRYRVSDISINVGKFPHWIVEELPNDTGEQS